MAGLQIIKKWDEPLSLKRSKYFGIVAATVLEGSIILYLTVGETEGCRLFMAVIGGCLLLACVTDLVLCQVYNFTWWPALTAAAILMWRSLSWMSRGRAEDVLYSVLFFLFLQFVWFCRMYGKADCYAFSVCAITGAARGMKAAGFLIHMLSAYVLLFFVQTACRNLDKRGNLKRPVPFLPYITISFWMLLVLGV